jgi:hypothetical protein
MSRPRSVLRLLALFTLSIVILSPTYASQSLPPPTPTPGTDTALFQEEGSDSLAVYRDQKTGVRPCWEEGCRRSGPA